MREAQTNNVSKFRVNAEDASASVCTSNNLGDKVVRGSTKREVKHQQV